ncbi:RGM domain family member B [Sciurus carolinensis]|uniref:RGM domain family member B n=1 Tax=Sciurus carolinensis TaxID=30640 RepID=A0AA41SVT0_SCICA|nr:RGM domain family member B [Sciurus carolinensis]
MAPAPPPLPEPRRPARTDLGFRAAPACAASASTSAPASAAATRAEQSRCSRLCPQPLALLLLLLLSLGQLHIGDCQQSAQCRIQKCTTGFVSLTLHLNSAIDSFDSEFCKALCAYAVCTQQTSKACHGNLVYYFAVLVQVMNVPVVPGSSATAMNKIMIIFKAHRECTDQKVYQTVTDDLPVAFVDGTTSSGDGEVKSLHMVERESGHYVEMHATL